MLIRSKAAGTVATASKQSAEDCDDKNNAARGRLLRDMAPWKRASPARCRRLAAQHCSDQVRQRYSSTERRSATTARSVGGACTAAHACSERPRVDVPRSRRANLQSLRKWHHRGRQVCDDWRLLGANDGCSANCLAKLDDYNCFTVGQPCVPLRQWIRETGEISVSTANGRRRRLSRFALATLESGWLC